MTDFDIECEWLTYKALEDLKQGHEPDTEDHTFILGEIERWKKEDDPIIDELEQVARSLHNQTEWEEVQTK